MKTQGSSTSFSLSYHSAIPENLFKGYFFTALVDFGVAFSINLLFSPDILGFRKALEHNAMSSSVSVVRRRKVLNACEISLFLHVEFRIYLFRLVISNPIKNCCLFIKYYINAKTFKIIQLDARKGVPGQLAIHAFNKSGRHLEFLIYDVIRGKTSAAIFEF